MNPITINEELARAIDIAYPDVGRENIGHMTTAFKNWPLLTYDFGDETKEQLDYRLNHSLNFFNQIFQTPFEDFRYWIKTRWGTHIGLCERRDSGLRTVAIIENTGDKAKMILKLFLNPSPKPGTADWNTRAFHYDGKEITQGHHGSQILPPPQQAALDRAVTILIVCLEQLSMEYLRPGSHVAKVIQDRPGKSVQWKQAREHYTVIHRHHEANKKGLARGSTVDTSNKEITRIAHSRRAHERFLRSPRFKRNADGTVRKLDIAQIWVGPDEWKDTAGQIYRIVNVKK